MNSEDAKTRRALLLLLSVTLFGCKPDQATPERAAVSATSVAGDGISETEPGVQRFAIESHGKFHAGFDNGVREILLITDRKTGKVYLGITGVGISELHSETTVMVDNKGNITTSSETRER